jgi:uncharacterized protein YecE (DUF72 family)
VRVGVAGWSYPDWQGRVYPAPKPRGFEPLVFLARYTNCLELDSSFYAVPRASSSARWERLLRGEEAFRLTAKLHRSLTHDAELGDSELERGAREFEEALAPLARAGRIGAWLAQFPASFVQSERGWERLRRLAGSLGAAPLVLELRHRSWFESGALARIEALGASLAAIDLPASASHPPPDAPALGPIGYLRLHGRNARAWFDRRAGRDQRWDYIYSEDEVRALAARARQIAAGRAETYVVANNHFAGQALVNAIEIQAELEGRPARAPATLVAAYPRLRRAARAEGQARLDE